VVLTSFGEPSLFIALLPLLIIAPGAFFLTFATTLVPFYNAAGAYDSAAGFHASFGFFPLFMAVLCVIYLICALRTNIIFVIVFFLLIIALGMLAGAHWQLAESNVALAGRLQIVSPHWTGLILTLERSDLQNTLQGAGAFAFVTSILGWYLLLSQLLSALDFPFQVPVGDLSRAIKSRGESHQQDDAAELNSA
jgi:uncharacterized protein